MDVDTIFAVASGAGQAAIAVMRLSGPDSRTVVAALCGRVPPPRRVASLRTPGRSRSGDGGVAARSRQATPARTAAELYLHGGRAVLTGVADALVALGAGRPSRASSPAAPS